MKHAYLYCYSVSANAPTEYVYVIAVSTKQARFLWKQYLLKHVFYSLSKAYYYVNDELMIIDENEFYLPHAIGDILGGKAVI